MSRSLVSSLACYGLCAVLAISVARPAKAQTPVTLDRVVELLNLEVKEEKLLNLVKDQSSVFVLGDAELARLRSAGASDRLIATMRGTAGAVVGSDAKELGGVLKKTDGAVKLTPSKDIHHPTDLEVGTYTRARLGAGAAHYWLVRFPAGESVLVADFNTPNYTDGVFGRIEVGINEEGTFKEEKWTSLAAAAPRCRSILRVKFDAPSTKLVKVTNTDDVVSKLADYQFGVFRGGTQFGVPFLVNSPEITPVVVGKAATSPLLGAAANPVFDRDAYFRVKLPEGDFLLDVQWSGGSKDSVSILRSVAMDDLDGIAQKELGWNYASEPQKQIKLQTADETEFLLKVRAAWKNEKVTIKITPLSDPE